MFTGRTAAKVVPCHQDGAVSTVRGVQGERGVLAAIVVVPQIVKSRGAKALSRRRRQEAGRDDLVRVDVLVGQHHRAGLDLCNRLHDSFLGSATYPATADAAAVAGLTNTVLAPTPWRPSKLRLLVLTLSWPGCAMSPFMPRHIEQPASRHSAPASRMILSRPSFSACAFTCSDPGTTSIRTPSATLRPLRMRAASSMSDTRPLVQLPTKTTSTLLSVIGLPVSICIYSMALRKLGSAL